MGVTYKGVRGPGATPALAMNRSPGLGRSATLVNPAALDTVIMGLHFLSLQIGVSQEFASSSKTSA